MVPHGGPSLAAVTPLLSLEERFRPRAALERGRLGAAASLARCAQRRDQLREEIRQLEAPSYPLVRLDPVSESERYIDDGADPSTGSRSRAPSSGSFGSAPEETSPRAPEEPDRFFRAL
jgi:hypothetical protein